MTTPVILWIRLVDQGDGPGVDSPWVQRQVSVVSVGRLLRSWAITATSAVGEPTKQNLVAVERWKSEVYPPSALRLPSLGRPSTSVMRRGCALTSMPAPPGASLADSGRTRPGTRDSINLISHWARRELCVSPPTRVSFESALSSTSASGLMHDCGSVFLVVDGHPVHRPNQSKTCGFDTWTTVPVSSSRLTA